MKSNYLLLPALFTIAISASASTTRYVDVSNSAPAPPYTNWASAATTIQDAVDAANATDLILVTNGVYGTGGRAVLGIMTNRVAVTKAVTIQSVNGPENTIIEGYQVPGATNSNGAIRCVYMLSGTLSGFTVRNGATLSSGDSTRQCSGGGIYCANTDVVVTNCVIVENSAFNNGGGVYAGWIRNCRMIGNNAVNSGGAAAESTLDSCTLDGNCAGMGGATLDGMLVSCVLTRNEGKFGGGARGGTLYNCTITGNSAKFGGGTSVATAYNCIIYYNSARAGTENYDGGTLNSCCTTPLPLAGPGNISLDPQLVSESHISPTSPCRAAGDGRTTVSRDFDGDTWRIPPSIGCDEPYDDGTIGELQVGIQADYTNVAINFVIEFKAVIAGQPLSSTWDFEDGATITNVPCVKHGWSTPGSRRVTLRAANTTCPEGIVASFDVQVVEAPLHYVSLNTTNPAPPYASWDTAAADIQSAVDTAALPGAIVIVNDGVYETGGRVVYGAMTNRVVIDKPVFVRSLHGPAVTTIRGNAVSTTNGDGAVRCVYLAQGATLSGFTLTNGATRTSGDIDYEQGGGGIWCEAAGAIVTNCVLAGNSAVRGGGACSGSLHDCVLLGNYATQYGGAAYYASLEDCILSNNVCASDAGAAYGGVIEGCTIVRNTAGGFGGGTVNGNITGCVFGENTAMNGAAARGGTLNGCIVSNNVATSAGGAVYNAVLNNCTIVSNTAPICGGVYQGSLMNCIVHFNSSGSGSISNFFSAALSNCCTAPLPVSGPGNFTDDPQFADLANGDLHLQSGSPCINAGRNAWALCATDFDGNQRIVGGTVDVGAYEFQSPASSISYAWLQQYGLPTDGLADNLDSDGDGMSNYQEWVADTNPTNEMSVLKLLTPVATLPTVTLTWQSSTNRSYLLQRATDLATPGNFMTIASNVVGRSSVTSFIDTNAPQLGPAFYRVAVQAP